MWPYYQSAGGEARVERFESGMKTWSSACWMSDGGAGVLQDGTDARRGLQPEYLDGPRVLKGLGWVRYLQVACGTRICCRRSLGHAAVQKCLLVVQLAATSDVSVSMRFKEGGID